MADVEQWLGNSLETIICKQWALNKKRVDCGAVPQSAHARHRAYAPRATRTRHVKAATVSQAGCTEGECGRLAQRTLHISSVS